MTDKQINANNKFLVLIIDLISMVISVCLASMIRYNRVLGIMRNFDQAYILIYMITTKLLINLLFDFTRHFYRRSTFDGVIAVFKEQLIFGISLIAILYMTHQSSFLSRLMFLYYILIDTMLMLISHQVFKKYMIKVHSKGKNISRLLILATRTKFFKAIDNILSYNEWYRQVVGVCFLDEYALPGSKAYKDINVCTNTDDFMDYVAHNEIDEVLIMDSDRKHLELIYDFTRKLADMGVVVNMDIDIFDMDIHANKNLGHVGKYAVVTFARNVLSTREMALKRALDIVGSLIGCIFLLLVSIIIVPAIKLDSKGPIFYKGERVGKNGRIFKMYKFRSMYVDADKDKSRLMDSNEMNGYMFKMRDDPRITRVGRFLRRSSLDEMPQFINVLKGDMSLVGTRPPTVDEYEKYEAKHKCRLSMTPGLTGMWQVSGRSDVKNFDKVVELDMRYIDGWTITKDIKILIKTLEIVLLKKGAE